MQWKIFYEFLLSINFENIETLSYLFKRRSSIEYVARIKLLIWTEILYEIFFLSKGTKLKFM